MLANAIKIYFLYCLLLCGLLGFLNSKGLYLIERTFSDLKIVYGD